MKGKTWGGRFRQETDALVNKINASIGFDHRLYGHDIDGSLAHCRMLASRKIITEEEASRMVEGLEEIRRELARGKIPLDPRQEDVHTLVETALADRIGPLAEKLHTGRSRNDQVALDVRLFVREKIRRVLELLHETQISLVRLAEEHRDLIMPGYTHMQRAQPVLLAHHLLAYVEMLGRDKARYQECLGRVNVMPLGSAALAGSTFALDRDMVARDLGFERVTANSMDAVSDRDFVLEFLFDSAVLMMHLSRLSEELILWSSQEFAFAVISDAFTTGSSIMPQKKNPDLPELIRGKTGRVYGNLVALLTTLKGLPLAYNKDMQEDKEALFDTADTVEICLEVMARLLPEVAFDEGRMREAAEKGFLTATDLADYLVRKGVTFRQAHGIVGKMVLFAADRGKELRDLTLEEMRGFSRQVDEDVFEWLDVEGCVRRRNIPGGTGPDAVRQNLERVKQELGL